MNPADEPKPEVPVDSVTGMHAPHMAAMNDPVMVTVGADPVNDQPGAGGQDSVQAMHGILMREHAEPRDGFEPVPFWVMVVFGALLMWGGYTIGSESADFRRDVYDTDERKFSGLPGAPDNPPADPQPRTVAELVAIGRARYALTCAACHKAEGEGDPALKAPPLKGSPWVIGAEASPARLARLALYGHVPGAAPAAKDYEVAAVLTFVRNSFGHKADADDANPTVPVAAVTAARAKEKTRGPFTLAELKTIPPDFKDVVAEKK
jgi:mono/diheme cytochrome c family protein